MEKNSNRLTEQQLADARLAAKELGARATADVLTGDTRSERDKLFVAGLGCLLFVTSKGPVVIDGLPVKDWVPLSPILLPAGMLAVLLYYLLSFGTLAFIDFKKSRLGFPAHLTGFSEWYGRLLSSRLEIVNELIDVGQQMESNEQKISELTASIDEHIAQVTERQKALHIFSDEYGAAHREIRGLQDQRSEVYDRYSNKDLGDRCLALGREHRETIETEEAFITQIIGRKWLRVVQRVASLYMPLGYGAAVAVATTTYLFRNF